MGKSPPAVKSAAGFGAEHGAVMVAKCVLWVTLGTIYACNSKNALALDGEDRSIYARNLWFRGLKKITTNKERGGRSHTQRASATQGSDTKPLAGTSRHHMQHPDDF